MPRGVPASGYRKPRRPSTPPPLAAGPVDEPARDDAPPAVPAPPTPATVAMQVQVDEPLGPTHPDEPPTPEQEEIKYLRDQLAQLSGRKDVEPEHGNIVKPGSNDNIVIHFLEDGMTALGKVWYRGQELEFEPDSRAYRDTFDRYGNSWLDLAGDDFKQVDRWGKVMFRPGPWPGKNYTDGTFEPMRSEKDDSRVGTPTQEELEAADKRRKADRAAPRIPQQV